MHFEPYPLVSPAQALAEGISRIEYPSPPPWEEVEA